LPFIFQFHLVSHITNNQLSLDTSAPASSPAPVPAPVPVEKPSASQTPKSQTKTQTTSTDIPFSGLTFDKQIGKGNFGAVSLGTYQGKKVAIKELFDTGDADIAKYYNREIDMLSVSRHPNIVQVCTFSLSLSTSLPRKLSMKVNCYTL